MHLYKGHSLSIVLSGGADTDVHVSYCDEGRSGTSMPGAKNSQFTASTAGTEILGGPPDGSHVRKVSTLSVRNIDSSSQTVTIKHSDGTTTAEIRKVTLTGGSELHYDAGTGWATISASEGAEWTTIVLSADVANADGTPDTLADITGLTFAVDSGDTYEFEAHIDYTSAATTTGARFTVNGPSMTRIAFNGRWTLTATTEYFIYGAALLAGAVQASSLTTGNIAKLNGFFTPSAGGTFAVQFSSEVASSAITAKAGSTLRYRRVVNA